MKARSFLAVLTMLTLAAPPTPVLAGCQLGKLAELPVTMTGLMPLVSARINGAEAQFVADSGAFFSLVSPAAAAGFSLKLRPAPGALRLEGIGGQAQAAVTTVQDFKLAGIPGFKADFIVAGSDIGGGAVGLLGQNVLRISDVEYDLANGIIRLMRPHDCGKAMMAYWSAAPQPYSVIDIDFATPLSPHTTGIAYINGTKIHVLFDTGAAASILTLRAAARAGVKPQAASVVPAGFSHGIGRRSVQTYVAPFAAFKIGDEEIRNTRLRFGDIALPSSDMLIGADFFLSHRIYVASSQRKLYFTYNGGPVFNLAASPAAAQAQGAPAPEPAPPQPGEAADVPVDAPAFSRRGSAFAARRDFERAIADLTRACELDPSEPRYFYERGMARLENTQPSLALADFDKALELKADDVPTLVARGRLRFGNGDASGAIADLDAADRFAPRQAEVRILLGNLYLRAQRFAPAIGQFDLWIASHPEDVRRVGVLNQRCWTRAVWGQELQKALADCDAALKLSPHAVAVLDSRGLVRLRMGDFQKSVADYDAALSARPGNAWSLYGRGVDELRLGKVAAGKADIAAATALQPHIAAEAGLRDLGPQAPN